MSAAFELTQVSVVRPGKILLDNVIVAGRSRASAGSSSGPNGAGKSTLMQVVGATMFPSSGNGRRSSATGSARSTSSTCAPASATPAPPSPSGSRRTRPSATPSCRRPTRCSAAGTRSTTTQDRARADQIMGELGITRPRRPHVRHAVGGRAQAHPDRPRPDDRSRAAAARRARRRARPRRPRGPARQPGGAVARPTALRCWSWCRTTSRRSRAASPTCCMLRDGQVVAQGPLAETLTAENLGRDVRHAARARPWMMDGTRARRAAYGHRAGLKARTTREVA